jgi:hypothetical protein
LLVAGKVRHDFGPTHYLTSAALTTADHCIGLIRKAIADAGIADWTTIAVVADHGFTTVRDEVDLAPVPRELALDLVDLAVALSEQASVVQRILRHFACRRGAARRAAPGRYPGDSRQRK